jgi:hypothetical protein
LKVLIAGNLANMGFEITKSLRDLNIDAELLMPEFPTTYEDPKFMYPKLEKIGYPKWIITYNNKDKSFGKNNWKIQIIRTMRKNYDVIIALTEYSILAMFSGKPYAALSTGSDMRELIFDKSIKGFLYKLSYYFAKIVIWGEPDKLKLLKKLKISKKAVFTTAPRNFEFEKCKIQEENLKGKFVIFHPSSQVWKLKKNNEFLEAFIKLSLEIDNLFLIISERGIDIEKCKKILDKKNLESKIRFVPVLNSSKMQYYYNLCDVVIDQFEIGSIGMISMEAMKCAKPILVKIDYESFKHCYKNPPKNIINVSNREEIFNELKKLATNSHLCKEIGLENYNWVNDNWDKKKLSLRYAEICKAIKENNFTFFRNNPKI